MVRSSNSSAAAQTRSGAWLRERVPLGSDNRRPPILYVWSEVAKRSAFTPAANAMQMVRGRAGPATQAESCVRAWAAVSRGRRLAREGVVRCAAGLDGIGGSCPKGGARPLDVGEAGDADGMAKSASMDLLGQGDSGGDDNHGAAGTYEQVDIHAAAVTALVFADEPVPACCFSTLLPVPLTAVNAAASDADGLVIPCAAAPVQGSGPTATGV
jgi:hypothetical protein